MDGDLEKAAAEGRAKRATAKAEKTRDEERHAEEARLETERRYWASVSRWGIFRVSGMGPYYLFFLWLFVLAPLNILILLWLDPPEWLFHVLVPGHGRLFLPIPATVVAIGVWYFSGFMCRRAVAGERAWLASLPFRVTGYEERLGVYPSSSGEELVFRLRFVGEAPGAAVVRDVLSSDGGTWDYQAGSGRATRGRIETSWKRSTDHNRLEARWFHALVAQQLRTLHARFPIESLAFAD